MAGDADYLKWVMASRGVLRFLRREEEEEHGFNPSHSWSVKPIITITTMTILVAIENLDGQSLCDVGLSHWNIYSCSDKETSGSTSPKPQNEAHSCHFRTELTMFSCLEKWDRLKKLCRDWGILLALSDESSVVVGTFAETMFHINHTVIFS